MAIIKTPKGNIYTLDNNGWLTKIDDMSNRVDWVKTITKIDRKLAIAHQNEGVVMLYRGESRAMFGYKTGTALTANEDPNYGRFFVIGSKAKSYLVDKDKRFNDLKQFDSNAKVKIIFSCLNKLSNKKGFKEVLKYFNDASHFTDFDSKLYGITNDEERLTLENFYLAFVHSFSSAPEEINAHSVLISSTRDVEVAKEFSDGGFIISFWLSNPIPNQAIDYNKIDVYRKLLTKHHLPIIDKILFPDESEVTIFSAIFPHNIFYVYDISKNRIIFNPYILDTDIKDLITRGFSVDQSNFNEELKGIYSRSIWRNNRRLIEEINA